MTHAKAMKWGNHKQVQDSLFGLHSPDNRGEQVEPNKQATNQTSKQLFPCFVLIPQHFVAIFEPTTHCSTTKKFSAKKKNVARGSKTTLGQTRGGEVSAFSKRAGEDTPHLLLETESLSPRCEEMPEWRGESVSPVIICTVYYMLHTQG
jgi:hypothetical protein